MSTVTTRRRNSALHPGEVSRASAARWTAVCALDDLRPGSGAAALVGGRQIALFRTTDGAVYALANRDPYSGAEVLSRGLLGDAEGRAFVASPLYKQRFDLATGRCLGDAETAVARFAVRVTDGRVLVQTRIS